MTKRLESDMEMASGRAARQNPGPGSGTAPAACAPILQGNHLPMWVHDRQTLRFLEVSDGALRQYGYSREEFSSLTLRDIRPAEELAVPILSSLSDIEADDIDPGRLRMHRRKDGSVFPVRVYANRLLYGERSASLVVAKNVSQQMGLYDGESHMLQEDWSLGLPKRQELEHKAQEALDRADLRSHRVAVVLLDLDNLEEIEERFGAAAGDACLRQLGRWLTRRVRGMDTIARTGMKAFSLILAELGDDFDLYRLAEALLKVFHEPFQVHGTAIMLSASIGIAVYPDDGFDFTRLCHAAETAMQQARAGGGHRIAMFSLESSERTELDAYMRESMKQGAFRLHYQPQYSSGGKIGTLEALLRLPGKESGFISPELFIPLAEQTGMIEPLGLWVIEEACRQTSVWRQQFGETARIAVNVSPIQLRAAGFAEKVLAILRAHNTAPSMLEFEITERSGIDFDQVVEPMRILAEAGIIFAVDDFGTGYSSLQHLHRLPISVLKIDRSFVHRMGDPQGAGAIVEAIVSMAHSLGMQVVAEGVETQAQRDAATGMGCDTIQGFLHASAMEAGEVPQLMGWARPGA